MFTGPERRRVARLPVPRHLRGGEAEPDEVRVLNLSPLGARCLHLAPWHAGAVGHVDFPPALTGLRLTARTVWTRLHDTERTFAGEWRRTHESGIEFTKLIPAQAKALADALITLQAAEAVPDREPSA